MLRVQGSGFVREFSFVPLGFVPLGFGPLNHGIWPLTRVFDPKPRVTNITGTNLKSLRLVMSKGDMRLYSGRSRGMDPTPSHGSGFGRLWRLWRLL